MQCVILLLVVVAAVGAQYVPPRNSPRSGSVFIGDSGDLSVFSDTSDGISEGQRSANFPQYEQHIVPRAGAVPIQRTVTVSSTVVKTHTLRVPATSDVWVTNVKTVRATVTQLSTRRNYVDEPADVVTSVVRVTSTPIALVTRTEEIAPVRTLVSVFTSFVTSTRTEELWQPIVHVTTAYEFQTEPVLETQTLLQHLFRTVTSTTTVFVTRTRPAPRAGAVPVTRSYGY